VFQLRSEAVGAGDGAELVRRRDKQYLFSSQFKNNYSTELCSGSEAGLYLRLIDFVYLSTLGLRVIKKKKVKGGWCRARSTSR